jgi:hypothetical protein
LHPAAFIALTLRAALFIFVPPEQTVSYSISKSMMISRRQGGGDEAYCTYVEEADDDANKDSALI